MTRLRSSLHLRSLRAQVLLWTILPLTILLIVVSLTGIGTHQASMRRLAIDENRRLVTVMAQALALLAADAPLSQALLDALLPVDNGYESQVLLIDAEDRILFSSGSEPEPLPTIQIDGTTDSVATFAGAEYIVVSAPVPGFSWCFVLREPLTHLTEPLIRFEQVMPFVLLIATVISFLTLFFGLRFIVHPLQLLAERTHRIGEGDFTSLGKPVGGVDEIEALRRSIDQMAERIQSYQAGLETYLHVVTRAQEDERARLARELHDETVQSLIALNHKTQKVQRTLDRDPALAHVQLTELRHLIVKSIGEVRRFSQALRPLYLEELGLAPALERLASESMAGFALLGEPRRLAPDIELALYRIAQESLNNARRHAGASQIEITLAFQPRQIKLTVCDDGIGFDGTLTTADFTRSGHFGLMGMHERAQLVGANLHIDAVPKQGVTITVSMTD